MDTITRLALKNRLLQVLMAGIALCFVLATLLGYFVERKVLQEEMSERLDETVNLMTINLGGAVLYGTEWVARDLFESVMARNRYLHILVLFSEDGEVISSKVASWASLRSVPDYRPPGRFEFPGHLDIYLPIKAGNDARLVGTLFVRADYAQLRAHMSRFLWTQLLVMTAVLLLTYLFGRRWQQAISARYRRQQEVLACRVEQRTAQLQRAHDQLHHEVLERREIQQRLERETQEHLVLIEKLEQVQSQLLQSEKMASIGQLAAGVAHEINNPIGFISSNLNSLQSYMDDLQALLQLYHAADPLVKGDAELADKIAVIKQRMDFGYFMDDVGDLISESRDGVVRVRKIIQDLKDFSRRDTKECQFYDLHQGIDSTLNVATNELKYKAKVIKDYADLPMVNCCLPQINQVVLNLLVNAVQAIATQGVITIRTGCEDAMVWFEVQDSGKGIAEAECQRIFEPFFTTKPVGEGTGLGLSLSYGIVRDHGGRIDVRSELGVGTCFRVWLPIEGPESASVTDQAPAAAQEIPLSA